MTEPTLASDLELALRLADAADQISAARFRSSDLVVTTKPDMTPVSDADKAVEQAIRAGLAQERPGDSILGEEFGTEGSGRRQWIIDPIDGTSSYVRGVPIWASLISLAIDGTPVLGVVSAPALGKRWWAATGGGAWVRDAESGPDGARRLHVSKVAELADASLSYNSIQQWDWHDTLPQLIDLSRQVWRTRAYGDMWSYMMVAEGLIDIAGEFDLQPYDLAALVPIVEEAGGTFTSAAGETGPWHGSALATNGLLHESVLRVIAPEIA